MEKNKKGAKKTKEINEEIEQILSDTNFDETNDIKTNETEAKDNENNLQAKIDMLDDKLKRTMAEFDNFRKRTIKEKSSMYDDGIRATIEKILPVVDNLERALLTSNNLTQQNQNDESLKEAPLIDNSSLRQGVEMTLRQFIEILSAIGVKEIEAYGKNFDPNIHLAVMHIEDESCEANTVVDVLQKGYIFKDKVIRYSSVKVAN